MSGIFGMNLSNKVEDTIAVSVFEVILVDFDKFWDLRRADLNIFLPENNSQWLVLEHLLLFLMVFSCVTIINVSLFQAVLASLIIYSIISVSYWPLYFINTGTFLCTLSLFKDWRRKHFAVSIECSLTHSWRRTPMPPL